MSTPKTETAEAKSTDTPADRLQELAEHRITLARLVARNESAQSELLQELSYHNDTTVRKWVCAHANTPPEALGRLGGQFPQQLMDNPALDFMILENPNLLRELPQAVKTSMLKRQICPASFIELMALDMEWEEGMQLAIAMNPNTPAHVIKELKKSSYNKVKDAAHQHVHAGGSKMSEGSLRKAVNDNLAKSYKLKQWMPWSMAASLDQPGMAERNVLREILLQRDMTDVDVVNPHTSIERVLQILPQISSSVRYKLAERTNTSRMILKRLVLDKEVWIREAVASNLNTPIESLQQLAEDKERNWQGNYSVRQAVVCNPNTPIILLQQLAQDKSSGVRIAVAKNHNTPVDVLQQLTQDKEWSVREIVAKNPHVQPEMLQQLAKDKASGNWYSKYPVLQAVARNRKTSVEILQLLAQGRSNDVHGVLAKNPNTPADVLQRLSQSREVHVRLAVAKNPSTPIETLQRLAKSKLKYKGDYKVRQAVVSNRIFPTTSKRADSIVIKVARSVHTPAEVLQQLAKYKSGKVRAAVAQNLNCPNCLAPNPATSLELLQRLSQDKDAQIRRNVVRNPSVPVEILRQLAQDKDIWVLSEVAGNPNTPSKTLKLLAQGKNEHVRSAVAGNPNTRSKILKLLAKDKDNWSRAHVGENSNTPEDVLKFLAKDKAVEVRERVAGNPNTPVEVLEQFAEEYHTVKNYGYRYFREVDEERDQERVAVAGNPNTPIVLLEKMAQDVDWDVREAVARNPGAPVTLLQKLVQNTSWYVRSSVAGNPHTPVKILQQLANDDEEYVRDSVAENPHTVAEDLQRLAMDKKPDVRKNVATHPNTPAESLAELVKDKDTEVAENAAGNPNCPPLLQPDEFVIFLASLPFLPLDSYKTFARHADPVVRAVLAGNPLAPTALLKKLTDDSDVEVRLALAKNSWVDPSIYALLSNDSVPKIRSAVARQQRLSQEPQLALAVDDQPTVRASLARNKNCSAELQLQLAGDAKFSVRKAVAVSPKLTTALIRQLSGDDDSRVRESVWKRTDLAQKLREQLDQEFGARPVKKARLKKMVKPAKADEPSELPTPDDSLLTTIEAFSDKAEYEDLSTHLISLYETLPLEQRGRLFGFMSEEKKQALPKAFATRYASILPKNPKPGFNRLLALMLDECPTPIIAKAVRSNDWLERLAIATHPKAPPNTLKILCNDGNKWVRQAAERVVQQQENAA